MPKVKYSFTDAKGLRWVACSECERGGNGKDADKCSCGWKIKKFNGLGCFSGAEIKDEK